MNASRDLSRLLSQWQQLTQAEAEVIESAAWGKLAEIQAAKSDVQTSIGEGAKFLESEVQTGRVTRGEAESIRAEAKRLISLEGRNQDLLVAQRNRLQHEKETLDATRRNLRKVRQSYAEKPQTLWEQYS